MRLKLMRDVVIGAVVAAMVGLPGLAIAQPATPAADSDVEANKALVRRFFEMANAGELETLTDVVAPDLVILSAPPGEDPTLAGLTKTLAYARTGLPDFAFRVDDLFGEGDLVVVRTTISGTHLGDFFGAPPTGKRIEADAIDVWRVVDGKLAENWHFEDILGVMEQLGAVPGAEATPSPVDAAATPLAAGGAATTDAATIAANKTLARRFHDDIFARGNLDAADEILAPGFVWHFDAAPDTAGVKALAAATREAFPDLALTADQVVAEGDRVAIIWTLSGTHQGEYLGAPASGNHVETSGTDIFRIENGKIAEMWTVGDDLGLLMQLGAFPAFGEKSAATPSG